MTIKRMKIQRGFLSQPLDYKNKNPGIVFWISISGFVIRKLGWFSTG